MKKLMLVAALAAGTACGSDDVTISAGTTTTAPEGSTTTAAPSTTVEPTTTTAVPEPVVEAEPVTTRATRPAPRATTTTVYEAVPSPQGRTAGGDGGWAIPTYIVMCESGGDWNAYNPSGASGPYQLMPMHFGGALAMNQSREAQHAKAAELWAGGAGRSHWAACL